MRHEGQPVTVSKSESKIRKYAEKFTVKGSKTWIKANKVEAVVIGGGLTVAGIALGAPALVTAGAIDIGVNAAQNHFLGKHVAKHEQGGAHHALSSTTEKSAKPARPRFFPSMRTNMFTRK